jgi:hypothetical protein
VRFLRPGLLALLLACGAGCAPVQPWERGDLAKPQMALEPSPSTATMRAHVQTSREAATGGGSAEGGGCGCS